MKPSSWDKQLGLASPLECAASQSGQTNNPSKSVVGLDVSHHARIFPRGGEKLFSLTSSFIGRALTLDFEVEVYFRIASPPTINLEPHF